MRTPIGFGITLLAFCITFAANAKEKLVFSAIENAPNGCIAGAVLEAAYQKIGIDIEIYFTSGKRALVVSSGGSVDGEVARIREVAQKHPTLVRIEVPIATLKTAFFTAESDDLSQLREDDLPTSKVGLLTGVVRSEQMAQDFEDVWHGQSYFELFDMLNVGNLDAVIADLVAGRVILSELGWRHIDVLEGVVRRDPLYHYLHEKNAHLAPEITAVLESMAASGEVSELIEQKIASILDDGLRCSSE
ncbi:Bacterial extracellular solute-binding proteins, family 3 [Roseibium album]|nr:Bacterial extracellular solute-binding proteins, family 3 [Roseibium album]